MCLNSCWELIGWLFLGHGSTDSAEEAKDVEKYKRDIEALEHTIALRNARITELENELNLLRKGKGTEVVDHFEAAFQSDKIIPNPSQALLVSSNNVPVFCARNEADLPNILAVLNGDAMNYDPSLFFELCGYRNVKDQNKGPLALVVAICGTDRIDIMDKELLNDLREKKGFENVIMVVLRRGNDPSKFKANHDTTINSGVGSDKAIIQLIYFKGEILDDDTNKSNLYRFFQIAKQAYSQE